MKGKMSLWDLSYFNLSIRFLVFCALFFTTLLTSSVNAGTFTAFGPKDFTRGNGKPVVESVSLDIKNPDTTYTLYVRNGGLNSERSRVSSAIIKLNGETVFGTKDFNKKISLLNKSVDLNGSNDLGIELRSNPKSGFTVVLEGEDNSSPDITISSPADGTYLNTPSITVSGTASDSISWIDSLKVNGMDAIVSGDSYTVADIGLSEGTNTITTTATDVAGNTADTSLNVILDTIAPQINLSNIPSITNNSNITITGSVDDSSPIASFKVNGVSTNLDNNSFSTSLDLLEGINAITISATDMAGNTGEVSIEVLVDTVPPGISIESQSDQSYLNTPSISVSGLAIDLSSGINKVMVNGKEAVADAGAYTVSQIDLVEGNNQVSVTATDKADNQSQTSITVILDTVSPQITIDALPGLTNDAAMNVIGFVNDASPISGFTVNDIPYVLSGNQFSVMVDLLEGSNTIGITAVDAAGNTGTANHEVTLDTTPPAFTITSHLDGDIVEVDEINLYGDIDDNSSSLTVNGTTVDVINNFFMTNGLTLSEGENEITVIATDPAGNRATTSITITYELPDTTAPVITVISPADDSTVTTDTITITGTIDDDTATVTVNDLTATVSNGTFEATGLLLNEGANFITVMATDAVGNTTEATLSITYEIPSSGPVPIIEAPPLDKTVATSMHSATEFLYMGDTPVQIGVDPATIEAKRVAVLRGRVMDDEGLELSGVKITILNHPEYGYTLTREDGIFDIAVNGGGWLTVSYEKDGYLPVQRKVDAPWRDYAWVDDVVMIPLDPQVTNIDLEFASEIQVARGSEVWDEDGTRQATMFFTPGTLAEMVLPDGTTQTLTNISVRATEYTVGENGPKKMPGALPATSGYTYAVELSIDEAIASGAKRINFSQPVNLYVENFLDFPVGGIVPVGYYNSEKAAWIPSNNGRIIKILDINNGMAVIDTDGSGNPADDSTLTELGITNSELEQLASLYQPGQSLWRVPITHFSPWDCNWPFGPPAGSSSPQLPVPDIDSKLSNPCLQSGSIIECENQVLGERIDILGTPFSLNYRSSRVSGRKAAYAIKIPLIEDIVPENLKRIDLEINVAGNLIKTSFDAYPDQTYTFNWDGKDAYGRVVNGVQPVKILVGYVYDAVYQEPAQLVQSFAALSGIPITNSQARGEITLWQERIDIIGIGDAKNQGFGGWSISEHHNYSLVDGVLYRGDGSHRNAEGLNNIITTVAGSSMGGSSGDGGLATDATINHPQGIAVGPDSSIYIADASNRIRRVGPDGYITTVAGNGLTNPLGDGGLAINASLRSPRGLDIGPDGSLYISEFDNHRIRKVSPDGIITTVAGNGLSMRRGDDLPNTTAIEVSLNSPFDVAIGPEGNLYIADYYNHRIRKVDPAGTITTVATTTYPRAVAIGPDGSLYVLNAYYVSRIRPDGRTAIVTGSSVTGYGIDVGPDGSLYISDTINHRIRKVSPDGIITTIAGNGFAGYGGDDGYALRATFYYPRKIAVGPDGSIYITDSTNSRIRKVGVNEAGSYSQNILTSSDDGSELYVFDIAGRHLQTVDAVTGVILYAFSYNSSGYLTSVKDIAGNITTIERDVDGNPLVIAAPGGQRTILTLDYNGYLESITNPANETTSFIYTNDGLLTSMSDPRNNSYTFTYDEFGLLEKDEDPAGGFQSLSRVENDNGYTVFLDTVMRRSRSYLVENLSTGGMSRLITDSSGFSTETVKGIDGSTTTTTADGTVTYSLQGPDPRFGMQAPLTTTATVTTPGGLVYRVSEGRTVSLSDEYDPLSLLSKTDTVTVNGRVSTSVYDATTKTITSTSPLGKKNTATIDDLGRLVSNETTGITPANFSYDTRGRLTTTTTGDRSYSIAYNTKNEVSSMSDPLGRSVSFEYDLAGRTTKQTLTDGRAIKYSYDANGNVASITPPGKTPHVFTYTAVNQTADYTPPVLSNMSTTATVYSYNLDKDLVSVTRPDGKAVNYDYDSGGRLSTVSIPRGETSYGYSSQAGNLSSITTPDGGTLSYTFDGSLPLSETWNGTVSGSVSLAYNNDFRVTSQSVNGANSVSYAYDNDGLLTQAGLLSISRNAQNGLMTGSALGNTANSYSYNSFGEVSGYTANVGGSAKYSTSYERDKLGRITKKTETTDGTTHTFEYSYDIAGRLTDVKFDGEQTTHYVYDSNGNRLSDTGSYGYIVGTYDAQDRQLSYADNTYTYTANGELKTKTTGSEVTAYNYDLLGNLISATMPDGTLIEYVIDGRNRRVGKKVNGTLVQGFIYAGQLNPVAELDGQGNVVSRFVYGTKGNVPDYMLRDGTTYRIVSDHLGSPRLIIDTATGTIAQQISYDEFGNMGLDTNPGFQPFGFAGGIYDQHTKLTRFGARDYDAVTGRWTAKDPIGFNGRDTNLFGYVQQNPVNFIDHWGLILQYADKSSENTMKPHIQQIMTTTQGKQLLSQLHNAPQTYLIHGTSGTYGPAYQLGNDVYVDPSFNPTISTNKGSLPASTTRILAHELGHLTGTLDDGPGSMNNVNTWENPIMTPLENCSRTTY